MYSGPLKQLSLAQLSYCMQLTEPTRVDHSVEGAANLLTATSTKANELATGSVRSGLGVVALRLMQLNIPGSALVAGQHWFDMPS